jgi:coenzyme F420 hydrogenase subunit beta
MINYKKAFIGYSNDLVTRLNGSSGGVVTEIFKYLLENRLVDGVIGVGFDKDRITPVYKYIENVNEVYGLSGSKYVFMGFKKLVDLLKKHKNKKIAVVSQPCFVNALRNKFDNIEYLISFFCGYNMSFEATKYLRKKSKVNKQNIFAINYRGGEYPGGFTIYKKDGNNIYFKKEHYEMLNLMFLRNGCYACGHYISNNADIVVGDAWIKNVNKSTLIIINSNKGDNLLKKMFIENKITLFEISKEEIIKMHRHNILYKQNGHGKIMQIITKVFQSSFMKKYAPLYFFGYLSKIRRMFKIGVSLNLKEVKRYE